MIPKVCGQELKTFKAFDITPLSIGANKLWPRTTQVIDIAEIHNEIIYYQEIYF